MDREQTRRQILAFALVGQKFAGQSDPVTALYPLLAPIALDMSGQRFEASQFQQEMSARYSMTLTRDVVDLFGQRLTQLGLIQGSGDRAVWNAAAVKTHNLVNNDSTLLDRAVREARKFREDNGDLLTKPFDEELFLKALMDLIVETQSSLAAALDAVDDKPAARPIGSARFKDPERYFASRFVSWTQDNSPEVFAWLAELGGAALVSEALVELRSPTLSKSVRPDLAVYLDSPFAMELIGVSGKAAQEDASYIVKKLKDIGITVFTFEHLVDEIRYNLKAVILADPGRRTGPSAQALLFQEVTVDLLTKVYDDPRYYLEEAGLKLLDVKQTQGLLNFDFFSKDDEHNFFASIQSYYNHPMAAERDATSVAWIMRRRKGDQVKDVLKAKHILLTRNPLLYRQMNKFCRERSSYRQDTVGPAVLARDLAGVLWLMSGSEDRQILSQRQLLLNCQRAQSNAPEIIDAMFHTIESVSKGSADLFMAAVRKPSYLSLALDAVASDSLGVSTQLSERTLDAIRDDLIADERDKSKRNIRKIKEEADRDVNLQKIIIDSLNEEKRELAAKAAVNASAWASVGKREWILARKLHARTALLILITFFVLMNGLVIFGTAVGTDSVDWPDWAKIVVGGGLAILVSLLALRFSPEAVSKQLENKAQRHYEHTLDRIVPTAEVAAAKINQPMLSGSWIELFDAAFQ